MAYLGQTEAALSEIAANSFLGGGDHQHPQLGTGRDSLYVGAVGFDPNRHSVGDIDYLSVMGLATDEDYVSQVLPGKPLHINVVADITSRHENPQITAAKQLLMNDLVAAIDHALPGQTDRVFPYIVGEASSVFTDAELIKAQSAEAAYKAVESLALGGLTLVVSDFERFRSAERTNDQFEGVIAIKANHLLEREVFPGLGKISLGGWGEVQTNKPKELKRVNDSLHAHHGGILRQLEAAGAHTASVVLDPKLPEKYNVRYADDAIAKALTEYNHNH